MQRGFFKGSVLRQLAIDSELPRPIPTPLRKRHKSRRINLTELVDIVHRNLVKHEHQKDLAREYYVVPSTVCQLVKKVQKSPKLLAELLAKYEEKEQLRKATSDGIADLLNKHECLTSVHGVASRLIENSGSIVKPRFVRMVMREDLHMSYRPIRQLTMQQNSDWNRLLRQQWALRFLELDPAKKVILNVDETWLDSLDYRRRAWKIKGEPNSVNWK